MEKQLVAYWLEVDHQQEIPATPSLSTPNHPQWDPFSQAKILSNPEQPVKEASLGQHCLAQMTIGVLQQWQTRGRDPNYGKPQLALLLFIQESALKLQETTLPLVCQTIGKMQEQDNKALLVYTRHLSGQVKVPLTQLLKTTIEQRQEKGDCFSLLLHCLWRRKEG